MIETLLMMEYTIFEEFKVGGFMDVNGIRYLGRFDWSDKKGPQCGWSASTVTFRFYGTGVRAKIKPVGRNYLTVLIDGEITLPSVPVMEEGTYTLASSLEPGEHEIALIKRTEFYLGILAWQGFDLGQGYLLPLPPAPERKIEVIGDSITCGFGNEGENEKVDYDPKYDNAYFSYASIAARNLKAQAHVLGWSGFGLVRDYTGNESNTLPAHYHRITFESREAWDFSQYIPQVVVINLGTNDFSNGYIPERAAFIKAYTDFIHSLHHHYPEAHILCSIGPLIEGEALEKTREYVKEGVLKPLEQKKKKLVHFLEYEHQRTEDGYGVSFHPSIITHEKMGTRLSEEIRHIMHWE